MQANPNIMLINDIEYLIADVISKNVFFFLDYISTSRTETTTAKYRKQSYNATSLILIKLSVTSICQCAFKTLKNLTYLSVGVWWSAETTDVGSSLRTSKSKVPLQLFGILRRLALRKNILFADLKIFNYEMNNICVPTCKRDWNGFQWTCNTHISERLAKVFIDSSEFFIVIETLMGTKRTNL